MQSVLVRIIKLIASKNYFGHEVFCNSFGCVGNCRFSLAFFLSAIFSMFLSDVCSYFCLVCRGLGFLACF